MAREYSAKPFPRHESQKTTMPANIQRITPFLWFDSQAEDAAGFYTMIFPNSRVVAMVRYDRQSAKASGQPEGSVMTVGFQLDGQDFTALNGGPHFRINEAVSFVVNCETQQEIDHYWNHLSKGGDPNAQQCGWLKDRFGVSWQVVPRLLIELLSDSDPEKASKAMAAMLPMKKMELEVLRQAVA
jgi:predicted 3-demethylubiquinone-9 3-methyltransferase (glyoxalase superfamily)